MITQNEASNFLMKASIGADFNTIKKVSQIGKKAWLEEQFKKEKNDSTSNKTNEIWNYFINELSSQWGKDKIHGNELVLPYWFYFRMAYWDTILKSDEILRHRIALALSEILVISDKSILQLNAHGLSSYYDLLYKHAFGSYEELLYDVSVHPCMGVYLTHINNPKEDLENNIHPDENYAREIMQLFTIGLYELNLDGSKKLDQNNETIASYDNNDIKEMAKVFTGLGPGEYWWPWEDYSSVSVVWGTKENKVPNINLTVPMKAFEKYHDKQEKTLLKKKKISANGKTLDDIKQSVEFLVKEQNTAVFISKKLIQSLVSSNPSKEYIKDVSLIFMNNKGKTGDLKAVISAILLHKEAKDGLKMKEPMLRNIQILKAFKASNVSNKLWGTGLMNEKYINQHPLSAPSVFNFFQNDYSPLGKIEEKDLVAPEFQLMNSATSIAYVNQMYDWFFGHTYLLVSTLPSQTRFDAPELNWNELKDEDKISLDLKELENLANNDLDKLLEHLSTLLTAGTLNIKTKEQIKDAITSYKDKKDWVVETALFMISISADFTIISGDDNEKN